MEKEISRTEQLRNLVATKLKVSPLDIKLSNESIDLNSSYKDYYFDGSMGLTKDDYTLNLLDSKQGLIDISSCVGREWGSNYAHSGSGCEHGALLGDIPEIQASTALLLVVSSYSFRSWEGSEREEESGIVIYKIDAKRMSDFLNKREDGDIKRWENFLNT